MIELCNQYIDPTESTFFRQYTVGSISWKSLHALGKQPMELFFFNILEYTRIYY